MDVARKFFTSKTSIMGLFTTLCILLTIPLALLLSQQKQDVRQRASEVSTPISLAPQAPTTGAVTGYVYMDDNNNGQRDANEKPYAGAVIRITEIRRDGSVNIRGENANQLTDVKTDSNGYFRFSYTALRANTLSYMVKLELPDGYKTVNTNPTSLTDLKRQGSQIVEFGIFPLVQITAGPTCAPRPACLNSVPRCLMPEPING